MASVAAAALNSLPPALSSMAAVNALLDRIDREFASVDFVSRTAASTGLRRAHLVIGATVALFFFIFVGFGAGFFAHMVGFLYPAYASFKAIESKDLRDDTQWLTYWVVFASFSIAETFTDTLLAWFPFYYTVKIGVLLYCQLPQFNGAHYLYTQFVRPWFERNAPIIESHFAHIRSASDKVVQETAAVLAPPLPRAASAPSASALLAPEELFDDAPPPAAAPAAASGTHAKTT